MIGTKVTQSLSVSPQISIENIDAIKAEGFAQIICNRPDGESMDQTEFADIETRAKELGLKITYQPINPMTLTPENAAIFDEMVQNGGKTFAYCRTGTRCITLWAMAQLEKGENPEEISQIAHNAGYDLSGLIGRYL
ncbi:MAG: TIGR01244 family phosphatase [Caulobacterales bacterium]|nr:TIGR01244 family phosphatase [Caulobacterales bacterium]MCA0371698.1 TIGR01244 family phosphatase [Pseudomonadota bacterium]